MLNPLRKVQELQKSNNMKSRKIKILIKEILKVIKRIDNKLEKIEEKMNKLENRIINI